MLDLLRILLCGIGVFYLVVRFGRLLLSADRGCPLWPPTEKPGNARGHAGAMADSTK